MTGLADTKLLTADDLLRLSAQGVRGELVRGMLHETMASGHRHGKIAVNIVLELGNFVGPRELGTLVASDSGVWLERGPDTVREPDVAFTSAKKIPLDAEIDGYAEVVPDLVVEIASPRDSRRWARDRAQMWLDSRTDRTPSTVIRIASSSENSALALALPVSSSRIRAVNYSQAGRHRAA